MDIKGGGSALNACISGFPRGATPGVPPETEGCLLRLSGNFISGVAGTALAFDHLWITPAGQPRGFVWSAVKSTEEHVIAHDKKLRNEW